MSRTLYELSRRERLATIMKDRFRGEIYKLADEKIKKFEASEKQAQVIRGYVLKDLFHGGCYGTGLFDRVIDYIVDLVDDARDEIKDLKEKTSNAYEVIRKAETMMNQAKAMYELNSDKAKEAIKFGVALSEVLEPMDDDLRKSVSCDIYAFLCGNGGSEDMKNKVMEQINE